MERAARVMTSLNLRRASGTLELAAALADAGLLRTPPQQDGDWHQKAIAALDQVEERRMVVNLINMQNYWAWCWDCGSRFSDCQASKVKCCPVCRHRFLGEKS